MVEEQEQVQRSAEDAGAADGAKVPLAAQMETPTVFLMRLSKELKETYGADADLAGILVDNLLTVAPEANVVANARTAIVALAGRRAAPAAPQEVDTTDG